MGNNYGNFPDEFSGYPEDGWVDHPFLPSVHGDVCGPVLPCSVRAPPLSNTGAGQVFPHAGCLRQTHRSTCQTLWRHCQHCHQDQPTEQGNIQNVYYFDGLVQKRCNLLTHLIYVWFVLNIDLILTINSSDAKDGIFWLWGTIPCLLMPWLLKLPEHQQAWYCQYMIGNTLGCSIVNFVFFCWTKSKMWYEMWIHFW